MNILVIGRTGQVGRALCRLRVGDMAIRGVGRDQVDLTDPGACAAAVAGADADIVINAAAYTHVDRAESEEALAYSVNAQAPGAMAEAAAARRVPFLHLSTDYVFAGTGHRPAVESDPTCPLNAYGRTKLAGEDAVRAAGGPHVILRTSWVFSAQEPNFVTTMLRVGASRDRLDVVDDQRGGPTAAADIASALIAIARAFAARRGISGTFHYAGAPATTWHGFAAEIFRRSGRTRTPVLNAIGTDGWPTPARRPADSRLDCSKIRVAYGIPRPDWRAALTDVMHTLKETAP